MHFPTVKLGLAGPLSAALLLTTSALHAQTLSHAPEPRTWYVQAGWAEHSAYAATLGVTLPWRTGSWELGGGAVRGHWDAFISNWSSRYDTGGRHNTFLAGIGPSLRWRGQQGQSPWFAEVGTSITYANKHYRNADARFSTRYNFASHIGVGMNFGPQRAHEVSLRVQHTSNASIKRPNPGENFVLLRYARSF